MSEYLRYLLRNSVWLFRQERDGYRRIIESYESEVTREVIPHAADRQQMLQQSVNNYKKANDELEAAVEQREAEVASLKERLQKVNMMAR